MMSIPPSGLLTPTSSRTGPNWVFKEGVVIPRGGAISSSCHLCDGWACAKDGNLTLSLLSHHSLSSSGRAQRHNLTLPLHPGLIVIFHSIAAFAACHLLMWWSFINVASHPPFAPERFPGELHVPQQCNKKIFSPLFCGKRKCCLCQRTYFMTVY